VVVLQAPDEFGSHADRDRNSSSRGRRRREEGGSDVGAREELGGG
jgi:hypothetical protein